MNSQMASDVYSSAEFADLLYQAELNASSDFEMEFVGDMADKLGLDMYLSEKQAALLERIAEGKK